MTEARSPVAPRPPTIRSGPATSSDDFQNGFAVGDTLIDTASDDAYTCVDNTNDAAVWSAGGGGGGGGLTVLTPIAAAITLGTIGAPAPASTWDTNGFQVFLAVDDMLIDQGPARLWAFLASAIDSESGPTIDADPNSIITSVAFITDAFGKRQVRVTASGNSGSGGVVSWTWNTTTFTMTVTATS